MKKRQDYTIITDITCDLSAERLEAIGVTAMPLHVIIDGEDYTHYADYRNISLDDFLRRLKTCNEIKTSQLDAEIAEKTMRSILREGKDILYISFSSSLSGTYTTAKIVAEDLLFEFPKAKIRVVDSLSASGGLGMLVLLAVRQKEAGMGIDELANWLEENRSHIGHWFTVDDLQHLKKGGRISGTTSFIGGILKVKPILHMNSEGKLVPHSKATGRKKSIEALVDKMRKHGNGSKLDTVFISHSGPEEDVLLLKEKIEENFEIREIIIEHIDPVIAAHVGFGGLALFFESKER